MKERNKKLGCERQERSAENSGTQIRRKYKKNCLHCGAIPLSHSPCTAVLDLSFPLPIKLAHPHQAKTVHLDKHEHIRGTCGWPFVSVSLPSYKSPVDDDDRRRALFATRRITRQRRAAVHVILPKTYEDPRPRSWPLVPANAVAAKRPGAGRTELGEASNLPCSLACPVLRVVPQRIVKWSLRPAGIQGS